MNLLLQKKQVNQKSKFGQYFTPKEIAEFMVDLSSAKANSRILEPACGEGIFLEVLRKKGFFDLTGYEIDASLIIKEKDFVKYESFVSANIQQKYDLIIGNPPYIRWKNLEENLKDELLLSPLWYKYFNSLCDYSYIFILKSIELLEENGELIFICPEYWINTTHSSGLRNYMMNRGYFEEIYQLKETPIFDKVNVSTIIFKYIKSQNKKEKIKICKYESNQKLSKHTLEKIKTEYIEIPQFQVNQKWLLIDEFNQIDLKLLENACQAPNSNPLSLFDYNKEKLESFNTLDKYCEIGNGLVSGLDKAFQLAKEQELLLNDLEKKSLLKVIKAKDLQPFCADNITNYIFLPEGLLEEEVFQKYPNFFNKLQEFKQALQNRYQYNRHINYWEWVFLRNFKLFSRAEKRIFVPSKERISHKNFLRFALVQSNIFPTQDVTALLKKDTTKESIEYILGYLNHSKVFNWLKHKGIIKGNIIEFSEKPLASIPFRAIDWNNEEDVNYHNLITNYTKRYLINKEAFCIEEINKIFDKLLKSNDC